MKKKIYLLLIVLFFVFIGAGGANSLLGSAWPAISADILAPISWQSFLIVIIYAAATYGSATAQNLLAKFGSWIPAASGIVIIAVAVFVFSLSYAFPVLAICGAFIGYGVGLEQSIINGYVTKHYAATAMSWLHCSYAIGCTVAPAMLSYFITTKDSWRMGYQAVGFVEIAVVIALIVSIPLWRLHGSVFPGLARKRRPADVETQDSGADAEPAFKAKPIRELLRVPGGTIIPINMYVYCSFEVTIFFWATSFLTTEKGMTAGAAAGLMTFFYGSQVAGRIWSGFLSMKFSDRRIMRVMLIVILAATVAFALAPDGLLAALFVILGVATGPLFPLLIHEVPSIVGKENAQGVIGLQLAGADLGNASVPLVVGVVASALGFKVFPVFLVILIVISVILKAVQDHGAALREQAKE